MPSSRPSLFTTGRWRKLRSNIIFAASSIAVSGSIVIDALGHPLPDPRLGGARPLRDCAEEVALGDDPDDPHHVLHDDDRADAGLDHLLGGLADRRRRIDGEDALGS